MAARSPRAAAVALARRVLPPRLRDALRRVPSVSVVVVVEPVDLPRLPAALASALDQRGIDLSVLLAPVAGTGAAAIDPRVRVLPEQPTWQEAASAAARVATGDHLVFVRGCDLLAPGALARAATALSRSTSAVCSGRLDQAGEPEQWLTRAQRGGLRLGLPGSMIRRAAWGDRSLAADEDWLLSVTLAALAANGLDALAEPAATWFPDHGTRAYGATPSVLPGLAAWRRRVAEVAEVVAGGPVADDWRRLLAGVEVPRVLQDAERADPDQWRQLRDAARSVCATPGWADGVPAASRAMVWLAAQDRRADLELVAAEVAALGDDLRTAVSGDTVVALWPVDDLPTEVRTLSVDETAVLIDVARTGSDRRVLLLVAVDHVDLADPSTRVAVLDQDDRVLEATRVVTPEADRWLGRRFQSATAVEVRVPAGQERLRVRVSVGGLVRTGETPVPEPAAPAPGPVLVDDLDLDEGSLLVRASGDLSLLRLLGRGDVPVAVPVTPRPGGVRLDLTTDRLGAPQLLAPGSYRLVAGAQNVSVGPDLRDRLPESSRGSQHRLRAHLGPRGGLVLELGAPLADDEVGPYAQERLQAAYRADDAPIDPELLYFESYAGRSATDSPRAIFEELRRRRPDVRAVWGVADSGQLVPEGAVPVLLRSREWYSVIARAGVLVLNTDTEVWFRRRPGQTLLQTFHGYPSKAMGKSQWLAKEYRPSRIREFRARGVDTWSVILTPTPEMTHHYREQYDYAGPALDRGYPRDDDLVAPDAAARREAARRTLGIAAGQTAVLYAPTWRDHLASRPRAAEMTDYLDVAAAAEALGDGYVLLLRGHRFHNVKEVVAGGARVVDVTAYPEVNDLILASDVAVLDYSSLRFDFALTGRPMVFLVPDLEEYAGGSRQFLFPFEDSAPGPFVDDTAGVVEHLLDPTLGERYAEEIAAFNARYNPWQDGHAAARVVDALERSLP